jgi:endonuclease YncB( thermonuclease family)
VTRALPLLLLLSLTSSALLAAPASAATETRLERGKVVHVSDGDTIDVDVYGDGTRTPKRIRLSGIQALEIGQCQADVATARLKQLILNREVSLYAISASSNEAGRSLRRVLAKRSDGTSYDVNRRLLAEGHALFFPLGQEWTRWSAYHAVAEQARSVRVGLWRDEACGTGPAPTARLELWAKSDADGDDAKNLNGEYVVIANRGSTDVSLAGWWLRDSSLFTHRFPSGTSVKAGGRLTVRIGSGTNSATVRYLGLEAPLLDNVHPVTTTGDGVYLFDPHGDLRRSFTWPCRVACSEPLSGQVVIASVVHDPPGVDTALAETVTLRNTSSARVSLETYQLRSWPYAHTFGAGTYLDPGEQLQVSMGRGTSTRLQQFLGRDAPVLDNAGDHVELRAFDERPAAACVVWGSAVCPR